jgi:amino acid adenylation domain-containing protein
MEHAPPLIAAILGVLKAGKIYLSLDPTDLATGLSAMLSDSRARLLLTDKLNASLAHSLTAGRLKVIEIADHFDITSTSPISVEIPSEAGAWLMYTSGSTGTPKGVWQNHCNVVHHTDVYCDLIKLTPDDRLSLLTSCSLAASATPLFAALLNGATLCPFHVRSQGVQRLADWLRQQRLSVYHSVPTVFRHLMRLVSDNRLLESLRLIRLGGEPVLRSDVEMYRQHCSADCILMHALSSTETGLISALMINRQTELPSGRVSVGRAVRDIDLLLVDERGQAVNADSVGRIAVRSKHLAQGYWLQPHATAEAFRTDARDPQTRLFVTGDLGQLLANGCIQHLGRIDQQVKIRGRRVDLSEVETVLQTMDMIEESVVTIQENASGEQMLIAYVVVAPSAGTIVATQSYRRLLQRLLPDYMIPVEFVPLACLPKTIGGKVDRLALPPLPRRAEIISRSRSSPRDRIEKNITAIWESVLGISPIGRGEDFFDLGGTSLQSIQVLAHIEDELNVVLSPSSLVEHNTIEKLAALVADKAVMSSHNPLAQLRASSTGRPLFLVHGRAGNVAVYGQLSRRLSGRPVYALQSIGLRAESWPLMSIPAMAKRYLQEIMLVDPTGPYMLAGNCMGGLIAFEMAQQLLRLGRPVGLVALINSRYPAPSGRRLRWTERVMVAPLRNTFRILRWSMARVMGLTRSVHWLPAYRHFVACMNTRARHMYRPTFYPGTITLILSANAQNLDEDMYHMMAHCARETRIITIPGDRAALLVPPTVDELARQLEASLNAAQSEGLP